MNIYIVIRTTPWPVGGCSSGIGQGFHVGLGDVGRDGCQKKHLQRKQMFISIQFKSSSFTILKILWHLLCNCIQAKNWLNNRWSWAFFLTVNSVPKFSAKKYEIIRCKHNVSWQHTFQAKNPIRNATSQWLGQVLPSTSWRCPSIDDSRCSATRTYN